MCAYVNLRQLKEFNFVAYHFLKNIHNLLKKRNFSILQLQKILEFFQLLRNL